MYNALKACITYRLFAKNTFHIAQAKRNEKLSILVKGFLYLKNVFKSFSSALFSIKCIQIKWIYLNHY